MLAVLISLALSQTTYQWTDKQGGEHFTDDLSSIPKGAKVRTMAGAPVSRVKAPETAAKPRDAGVATAPMRPTVDTCELASTQVRAAEDAVKAERARPLPSCQDTLRLHGDAAFASCMAAGGAAVPDEKGRAARIAQLEQQVIAANEALRVAKASGCR